MLLRCELKRSEILRKVIFCRPCANGLRINPLLGWNIKIISTIAIILTADRQLTILKKIFGHGDVRQCTKIKK